MIRVNNVKTYIIIDTNNFNGSITASVVDVLANGNLVVAGEKQINIRGETSFLRISEFKDIPLWVVILCAITMAAGTAAGGWRIIRTMGHKMVKLQPVHGFAAEFAEHREYAPGDDLRYVDWKVFGKSDRIYLKQYDEETNFVCHLLVDKSESMTYKSESAPYSKYDYARYVAAALAYLIIHQQDSVGLATFDSSVGDFLRPKLLYA